MKIDKQIEVVFEEIINLLYKEAYSTQSAMKWVMNKYGLEISRSYDMVREAKEYFGKFIMTTDVEALTECIEVLKTTREKAMEVDNLKEVRECTKEIGKLQQLYIQRIELDVKSEQPLFGLTQSR